MNMNAIFRWLAHESRRRRRWRQLNRRGFIPRPWCAARSAINAIVYIVIIPGALLCKADGGRAYGYRDSDRSMEEGLGESRYTRTAIGGHIIAAARAASAGSAEARASLARSRA